MNQPTDRNVTSSGSESPEAIRSDRSPAARKLSLRDWAAIAEIVSSVVVVASLIAVVYSLERNTAAVNAELFNGFFDAMREIESSVAMNPEFAELVYRGQQDYTTLNDVELMRYGLFLTGYLDIWEQMWDRRREGVVDVEMASDWDSYWGKLMGRHLTPELWQLLVWQYNEAFVRHAEKHVKWAPQPEE